MVLVRLSIVGFREERDDKTTLDVVHSRALLITDESCHRTAERIINHLAIAVDKVVDVDVRLRACSERTEVLPVGSILPGLDAQCGTYILVCLPYLFRHLDSKQHTK